MITGSQGMAAKAFLNLFSQNADVTGVDKSDMDITLPAEVSNVITSVKPSHLIHLAAQTDVDYCQENPDEAYSVNSQGTRNIAEVCSRYKIFLVYVSTSSVFGGDKAEPYSENDEANPINTYGLSKLKGEEFVERTMRPQKYIIVRAGWFFGGEERDKNFVGKIVRKLRKNQAIEVVDDIYGSPTYTLDLANGVRFLMTNDMTGLFHLANEGFVSRYDIAVKIAEVMGVDQNRIVPVSSSRLVFRAPRPRSEALVNERLNSLGKFRMTNWKESLGQYLINKLL
ncbi:dTDP-4-dehydrorhamnose reductase [bacterium]|nr:dTDP-4-dehydrorhamnose reductase [bacterium]